MDLGYDGLSCHVCLMVFNDPRVLPCGHSFCSKCLLGTAGNNKIFPCPTCRAAVDLKSGTVNELPRNVSLCHFIELNKKMSVCSKHNKLQDIFCKQCNVVICSKCLPSLHDGHGIGDIDDVYKNKKDNLIQFLATTKLWHSKAKEKEEAIKLSRVSTKKNVNSAQGMVADMFKEWYDALRTQETAILDYVAQETEKRIKVCDEAEKILQRSMTCVADIEKEINTILQQDISYVIQEYESVKTRYEVDGNRILQDIQTCFVSPKELKIQIHAPGVDEAIVNIKAFDAMTITANSSMQRVSDIIEENGVLNSSRSDAIDLQQKIAGLETQIATDGSEKEDALRRLSSMASAKRRDNNPNIADLSDPKRPTKIAEILSEIYDNDHLEKNYSKKEEDNVQLLLNVLIEVHQQINNQSEDILSIITAPLKPTDIPPEVRKNLKDAVKMLAKFKIPAVVKDIKRNLPSRLSNAVHLFQHPGDVFDVYIDKCIQACLLMSIQDPPMYLSAVPNKDGLFSHALYRAYTKSGKYEVFIVWPVLYLHKNGPMMAKGVAQGTDDNTMIKNNSNQSYQQPAPYHYVARRQHNYEHRQQYHQEQDWNQYGGMQTSYESPADNRLPTKNPSHYRGQGSSNKPFSKTYHPGTSTSQNTAI